MKKVKYLFYLLFLVLILVQVDVQAKGETSTDKARKIRVAVLDSGVDNYAGIPICENVNFVEEESEISLCSNDMNGHGTSVASVIYETNTDVEIISVKVLNSNNEGKIEDVIKGIEWCIANDIDIINMSFSTAFYSDSLQKVINEAYGKGMLLVGSCDENSAYYINVVTVVLVEEKGNFTDDAKVELFAPGENIETTSLWGLSTVASGSSLAVPYVVGCASEIWEQNGFKSNTDVRCQLKKGLVEKNIEANTNYSEKLSCSQSNQGTVEPIVYGNWNSDTHKKFISEASGDLDFTATELKIIKAGAVYPDKAASGFKYTEHHPEWHGYYTDNYVASYICATKIAKAGGDTSSLKKVSGQTTNSYNVMKNSISTSGISGKKWKAIFADETNLDYSAQNTSTKKRWRQLFLYGMSIHISTDVFAHSAYTKETNGSIIELTHARGADNTTIYKYRAKCAQEAAWCGLANAENDLLGEVFDFCSEPSYFKNFHLKNITNYSIAVNDSYMSASQIREVFKPINY